MSSSDVLAGASRLTAAFSDPTSFITSTIPFPTPQAVPRIIASDERRSPRLDDHSSEISGTESSWTSARSIWSSMRKDYASSDSIPEYVFDYAPYVHLYSGEEFWPCKVADHLKHTSPHINYTVIKEMADRNVDNLDELNRYGNFTFLQSNDNVEKRPSWLLGRDNIPKSDSSTHAGRSEAPSVLLSIRKPGGVIDAFWFYFYCYNLGPKVLTFRFGNHVGDWEHTMVRFRDGRPDSVFLSEHSFGQAYSYSAMEKIGQRPLTFSAHGSHAMYATPGKHPYALPFGLLHDTTDRGSLWDPAQNVWAYNYDLSTQQLRTSKQTPEAPTAWFGFLGFWGDCIYPLSDKRQYKVAGQYHHVGGPPGPIYKDLDRQGMCQGSDACRVLDKLPRPQRSGFLSWWRL